MLRKIFVAAIAVFTCSLAAKAQTVSVTIDSVATAPASEEKQPTLTITGSVDAYYKYDLGNSSANGYTSFTQTHNNFSLGMASIKFEHHGGKVGAVADLGFGQRAKDFSYNDAGITQAIKQLYVTYAPADWIKFSLGTWGTHVGYELLDPQLNRNYSMSYMFTNGPFSHTGFKAELTGTKHGLMVGIANATDYRSAPADHINRKFLIAQYSYAPNDKVKLYLNYAGGQNPDTSKTSQFDLVLTSRFSDKFNLGFNATLNSTKAWDGAKNLSSKAWWGSAVYLNFDPKPWFGLTLREEYFSDKNNLKLTMASSGCTMFASTLSANFKTGGFIFIPEFRLDQSNHNELFTNKAGDPKKSAGSFILAAIYSF